MAHCEVGGPDKSRAQLTSAMPLDLTMTQLRLLNLQTEHHQ